MLIRGLTVLIFIINASVHSNPPASPTVQIKDGLIKGITLTSAKGRSFNAFRGIPYAKPPVGPLRFKAPEPISPWDGILDATKDGPVCMQKNYLFSDPQVEGQEDCLYLNVYVPNVINAKKPLPVMLSIHWGGFIAGRGTSDYFGPEYIMDRDVILVTFNYRLGILGFLSTLDDEAPGNYALKDQVAAMKWIQNNIAQFNGNPKNVTIFGTSAGAGSVHLHLLSPLSEGLFHQAISQSGSALALWATPLNELHKKVVSVQALLSGCDGSDSRKLIECLRKANAEDLVNSGDSFKYFSVDPLSVYTLVTENKTEKNPNPFLTKLPLEYIKAREFKNIPWIIGVVQNEGVLRASPLTRQSKTRTALNANFTNLMIREMFYEVSIGTDVKKQLDLFKKAQNQYMNAQEYLNPGDSLNIQGFVDLWSDRSMVYPFYQSVMLHAAMGHKPIWAYSFEYQGRKSYETLWAATGESFSFDWGVSHCDDLLYLFKSPAILPGNSDTTDDQMREIILDRWTNFAIYGKPQRSNLTNFWKNIEFSGLNNMYNDNLMILNITGSSVHGRPIQEKMQKGFYKERMQFWESQPLFENFEGLH